MGQLLLSELRTTDIEVSYIIDKKAEEMSGEVPIYSLRDDLPKVDAIVVTIVNEFDSIEKELLKKCNYDIIPIEIVICGSSEY